MKVIIITIVTVFFALMIGAFVIAEKANPKMIEVDVETNY